MRLALIGGILAIAIVVAIVVLRSGDSDTPSHPAAAGSSSRASSTATHPRPEVLRERIAALHRHHGSADAEHADSAGTVHANSADAVAVAAGQPETVAASAFAALKAGDASTALARAEQVLATEPTNKGMLRVAGQAACMLGKADVAQRYYDAGDHSIQTSISSECVERGIRLEKAPKLKPGRAGALGSDR